MQAKRVESVIEKPPVADKKALPYEFNLDVDSADKLNILGFRRFGLGGLGTHYSYVTQFPFRGHDQDIESTNQNNQ